MAKQRNYSTDIARRLHRGGKIHEDAPAAMEAAEAPGNGAAAGD